ncbi:MAG TPA: hypothetical protein VFD52_00095 [Clostridia bacterium]|nr:hypothetical protein [Clostridia bacterium]
MLTAFYDRFKYLMNIEPNESNESKIREEINILLVQLHVFFDKQQFESTTALHEIERACHNRLRLLQNRLICKSEGGCAYVCDLHEICENICFACDLALNSVGKRVIFDAEDGDVLFTCYPHIVTIIVLNMISNACIHTSAENIFVAVRQTDSGAVVKTSSEGTVNFNSLSESLNKTGSGVAAMLNGARLHNATIMWGNTVTSASCAVCFPFGEINADYYTPPDFTELLCDRLSPVYTGLCGII